MKEKTSLQWFGQRTAEYSKVRGIKQGCPLSPKLFVYLLDQALLQVQREMPELSLGQAGRIKLPCLRVYADDIIAILTHPAQIARLISILSPALQAFGLELNVRKTEVLVRDPSVTVACDPPREERFGPYSLRVVTKMRYLGVYLTSSLNRKEAVAERISKAFRVYRSILSFVRSFRLRWKTARRIYHTVIAPIVLYGLKVTTLTKENRDRLRDMEAVIVSDLYYGSDDVQSNNRELDVVDVEAMLEGMTIVRKIRIARILYWGHLQRMDVGAIQRLAAEYSITGPFKRGRPCYNWEFCVEQDILCTRLSNEHIREAAESRERMKSLLNNMIDLIAEEVPDGEEYEEDFVGFSGSEDEEDPFSGLPVDNSYLESSSDAQQSDSYFE